MQETEILTRLAGLHVVVRTEGQQVKARMTRPGLPIPEEARSLIREVKPYLVRGEPACAACQHLQAPCAEHYWHLTRGFEND